MENRKYELTNISMEFEGRTLYRIRALKDFSDVKAGDLGGWVSNEDNLRQEGNCWIYNNAKCMDSSRIYDNSAMYDNAVMYNSSKMHDFSAMFDDSKMRGRSEMHSCSGMFNDSILKGEEKLYGELISKVDKFIDISNPKGKMVTGVLKDGEVLFNVENLSEINKKEFLDILYNGDEITEESFSRKEYLKIINIIILYLLG